MDNNWYNESCDFIGWIVKLLNLDILNITSSVFPYLLWFQNISQLLSLLLVEDNMIYKILFWPLGSIIPTLVSTYIILPWSKLVQLFRRRKNTTDNERQMITKAPLALKGQMHLSCSELWNTCTSPHLHR